MNYLNGKIREILSLKNQASHLDARAGAILESIQKKIRKREGTTGNRISDFVVCCSGVPENAGLKVLLRSFENGLRNNRGQLVLVARAYETTEVPLGIRPLLTEEWKLFREIGVGLIDGTELALDTNHGTCSFPVSSHATWKNRGELVFNDSSLPSIWASDLISRFEKKLEIKNESAIGFLESITGNPVAELEVRFGDEDVARWFAERGDFFYTRLFEKIVSHFALKRLGAPGICAVA
ncbi:MAG: hypothetical protein AAB655_02335 [Patescibacteria group bacterium]